MIMVGCPRPHLRVVGFQFLVADGPVGAETCLRQIPGQHTAGGAGTYNDEIDGLALREFPTGQERVSA
jgi:hypothetical protein